MRPPTIRLHLQTMCQELTAAEARTLIDELAGALAKFDGIEDRDTLEGGAPIRYLRP